MKFTAKELAEVLKGTVDGDPQATASTFAKIEHGKPGQLCFYANPKYEEYVYTSKASILLVNKDFEPKEAVTPTLVRVENAYSALADLLEYVKSQGKSFRRHRGRCRIAWILASPRPKPATETGCKAVGKSVKYRPFFHPRRLDKNVSRI